MSNSNTAKDQEAMPEKSTERKIDNREQAYRQARQKGQKKIREGTNPSASRNYDTLMFER